MAATDSVVGAADRGATVTPMRVFLTGGTGLLGSHLAELLTSRGHEVVALRRSGSDVAHLVGLGCELAEGDVRDPAERLAPAMRGCTHLVHGAALVYDGGTWPEIQAVNVAGTRNVLGAAGRAGVGHAVHLSSVAVYGGLEGRVDETRPIDTPIPARDLYARSKRESERVARKIEADRGLSVSILRPSAVYGERDRLMAPNLATMVRRPVAFLLGSGNNTVPAVYAGNVAEAVALALVAGRGGTTWDVGLDHPVTQRQLLEGIARGLGSHPRFVRLPERLVLLGADTLERFGVSAPGAEHLPLGRVARLATRDNPYHSTRIREDLGWTPSHPSGPALERTGRWLAAAEDDRRAADPDSTKRTP